MRPFWREVRIEFCKTLRVFGSFGFWCVYVLFVLIAVSQKIWPPEKFMIFAPVILANVVALGSLVFLVLRRKRFRKGQSH